MSPEDESFLEKDESSLEKEESFLEKEESEEGLRGESEEGLSDLDGVKSARVVICTSGSMTRFMELFDTEDDVDSFISESSSCVL